VSARVFGKAGPAALSDLGAVPIAERGFDYADDGQRTAVIPRVTVLTGRAIRPPEPAA
jgi:hypothetical protein